MLVRRVEDVQASPRNVNRLPKGLKNLLKVLDAPQDEDGNPINCLARPVCLLVHKFMAFNNWTLEFSCNYVIDDQCFFIFVGEESLC